MKKHLIYLSAVLALVACNKENSNGLASDDQQFANQEISINTATVKTKGYVTGAVFYDTATSQLHQTEASTTERDMKLSAYLTPQSGAEGNYFVDYTFSSDKNPENARWHHDPAVFWPVAGTLDFLAYSSKEPFDAKDVAWNEKNASESVVLQVLEDRTQDDIVFCSAAGKKSADGATAVAMEFKHAQAWLEFQIKVASGCQDRLAIENIVIENIYNDGELTIENNNGDAKAEWSFRKSQSKDVVFEDNYNLYGSQNADYTLNNAVKEEISYMDMLLPEQAKTSFIIKYRLAGQPNLLQYRYTLGTDNWLQGNRYVYEISFIVNEITVAPTVKAYHDGSVEDLTPSELI